MENHYITTFTQCQYAFNQCIPYVGGRCAVAVSWAPSQAIMWKFRDEWQGESFHIALLIINNIFFWEKRILCVHQPLGEGTIVERFGIPSRAYDEQWITAMIELIQPHRFLKSVVFCTFFNPKPSRSLIIYFPCGCMLKVGSAGVDRP